MSGDMIHDKKHKCLLHNNRGNDWTPKAFLFSGPNNVEEIFHFRVMSHNENWY